MCARRSHVLDLRDIVDNEHLTVALTCPHTYIKRKSPFIQTIRYPESTIAISKPTMVGEFHNMIRAQSHSWQRSNWYWWAGARADRLSFVFFFFINNNLSCLLRIVGKLQNMAYFQIINNVDECFLTLKGEINGWVGVREWFSRCIADQDLYGLPCFKWATDKIQGKKKRGRGNGFASVYKDPHQRPWVGQGKLTRRMEP